MCDAATILKEAKDEAAKLSKASGMPEKATFETRGEARPID
jgi:hypothetical protein